MLSNKTFNSSDISMLTEKVTDIFVNELERHHCSTESTTDSTTVSTAESTAESTAVSIAVSTAESNTVSTAVSIAGTSIATSSSTVIDLTTVDSTSELIKYKCTCTESFWRQYTAGHICIKVLQYCIDSWEKLRQYDKAIELLEFCLSQSIYGRHYCGRWYERITLNLDIHINDYNKVCVHYNEQ